MAKKDDHDLPKPPDFDELDFGSMDFDAFGDGAGKSKKKGNRTPYHAAAEGFLKSTKDRLIDRSFVRRMLSGVLPKGYTQALNTYDAVDRGIASILKDNKSELDPYLRKLKASSDRDKSVLMRFLPKSARDAIEDSDSGSSYSDSRPSELDSNLSGLGAMFKAQAAERMQDTYMGAARDIRDQKRFELDMHVQTSIGRDIGRLVGYQDNVLIKYHQKSLEIGYRQLDVNMKMFSLQREYFTKSQQQFEKILENTALPDFAKMTHGEVVKQQLSNKLAGDAINSVSNFTTKYFGGLTNNVNNALASGLNAFSMFKDMDMPGMSKSHMVGDMLGQFAGQAAAQGVEYLISLLSDRYGVNIKNNKHMVKGDNTLRDILSSIPQRMNEYAKSEGTNSDWFGLAEESLKGMLDTYSATSSIKGTAITDLDKPAYMDNLFYKSVTDIMPGLMASMDRSLKVLVTGEDHEEVAYSHYSGGFVSRSTLNKQHVKSALMDGGGDSLRQSVDGLLRQMGASELSLDAKKALRRALMKDMANAHRFVPARYVKIDTWKNEPEEIANELIEFFATRFGLSPSGEQMDDSQDTKRHRLDVAERFSEIQSRLPEFGERMDKLSGVVGRRTWRELGLSRFNGNSGDIIDLEKVYDLILNSGDDFDPKDEEKLKKTMSPEQWRLLMVEKKKKLAEKEEKLRAGASNEGMDVFNKALNRNLGRSVINTGGGPASASTSPAVQITWPELLNARDEGTHTRLDAIIGLSGQSSQLLELIAQLIPNAGGSRGGGGGGGGGGGPEGDPEGGGGGGGVDDAIADQIAEIKKRWYDSSIRDGAGGAARAAKSTLFTAGGMFGKYLKFSYGTMFEGAKLATNATWGLAKFPFKSLDGFGVSDIHKAGDEIPVMLARDIRKGYYFDVESKKVVSKLKDITGPVKDLRTDEVVLTQEDIDAGLYSGTGESLSDYISRVGLSAGGMLARGTKAYIGATYGTMWKVGKFAARVVLDQFTQFDAYLPGDTEPRIRSVLMRKGAYRTSEGAVITSLKDIKGPVYEMDTEGNRKEIVSQEEIDKYKSFYTVNGSVLYTVGSGLISMSARTALMAGKAAKWYGKKVAGFYKGIATIAGGIGRGIKNFVMGRFKNGAVGMLDDEMAMAAVEIGSHQLQTQLQILEFMKSRWDQEGVHGDNDGDGVRDWSWQDILKRRKAKLTEKASAAGAGAMEGAESIVDAIKKMNKNLDEKLEELRETTEEAGENGMLENAGDIADIADAGGRRGKGRAGKAGKAGKLARAGSWLKGKAGGVGNAIKKVPGGGALLRAGGWLGRGAWAAATFAAPFIAEAAVGLAGVISAPVVLGAVAVGAVAYGGYKLYKSEQAKDYPLIYLRMTQYGVSPTDAKRVNAMIQLEGNVRRGTTVDSNGNPQLDPSKMELNSILEIFDATDEVRKNKLFSWIQNRFKPVYLAHCAAMLRIRKTTDLSSVDTGVGDSDLDAFLGIVDATGMQAMYDDLGTSPFDGDLTEDSGDVESAINMVKGKRKFANQQKQAKLDLAVSTGNTDAVAKAATVAVTPGGTGDASQIARGLMIKESLRTGRLPMGVAGVAAAANVQTSLDIPTAVRYITYGVMEMKLAKCIQLQKVEEIYWPALTYMGTSKATLNGNPDDLEARVIDIFKPSSEPERADVQKWVRFRFLPAFLQYAISVRRRYNGDAKDAARNLTGPSMRQVLDEMTRTVVDTPMGETSVWKVGNTPWPGEMLESMAGATKAYIDALDKEDNAKVLDVKGMQAQKNQDPNDYGKTLTNTALGNQRANASGSGVNQSGPTLGNYAKIYGQGQVAGGAKGQSVGYGTGAMLMNGPAGTQVKHPGGGTGGDINSLPNNTGKGVDAMGPIITQAANMVGFDPEIALNVAAVESGMDPTASSGIAFGLFQFVSGTWGDMMRKYGDTYGIAPNTPPSDPRANAILGACYLKENYEGLTGMLGGNVSDVDLYAAHFLGLGGAKRFLPAPNNESAAGYVSEAAIRNNQSVFLTKDGRMRTVGEVKQELQRRIQIGRKKAGIGADKGPAGGVGVKLDANGLPIMSSGAAGAGADDSSGPTSAGAAMAVSDAAAAANGGASGSPAASSSAPASDMPVPADVAAEVNGAAPSADAFGGATATPAGDFDNGSAAPTFKAPSQKAPAPSATRSVATDTVDKTLKQQAASAEGVGTLLQQQLTSLQSMDTNILDIRNQLIALINKSSGSGGSQQSAPKQLEPARKDPINTKRAGAVT